ncbi:MAG: glycosyltransferase family 2 protein [bacterium]|nr:glycosyltransferase family 2 protein [bacterium]
MPKLSIIIVNFNTRELLRQCLKSIVYPCQIIVVDNNSSDKSVEMVKKEFPKVEVLARTVNEGYVRNNNAARKLAKGEYVLFLNSDTKAFPETLKTMVEFMDSDKTIGISTCLTELPNGKLYYACHRGFPTPLNSLLYFLGLPSSYYPKYQNIIHEIDACSGTFLLIQKRLLDLIGWFDEDYFSYGEDLEMCYRVKELGYKVMFNPNVKLIHYWRASTSSADQKTQTIWKTARYNAMKIFYDKHYRLQYSEFFRLIVFFGIDFANKLRKNKD